MSKSGLHGLLLLLVAALLVPGQALAAEDDLWPLTGLEGEQLGSEELAEGVTILVVWASWSPRCRDIGERVERIRERWATRARIATVNFQENEATAREFARRQRLKGSVYLDGDAAFAKRYAVTSLPFLVVFEAGEVGFSGKLPADADGVIGRTLD